MICRKTVYFDISVHYFVILYGKVLGCLCVAFALVFRDKTMADVHPQW